MEPTIFRFVIRYSLREQILVILLTAVSMPFVYLALEVPKRIINEAIGGTDMPQTVLGWPMDQVSYLFLLCGVFLLLTLINGGFKYVINVYRGVLGERMLRRLRYQLYHRLLRFPLPHFKQVSQGELIPMITAETEPLGGFIGDAFALPAFQGGLLVTYLFFIFNQDPLLGMVATSMYPLQAFLIPRLQRKVNQLARQRVLTVRKLADRIGESVAGAAEIRANGTSLFERADIGWRLGEVYRIRFEIYRRKFFIKFFNNFLTQVTPFFFYAAGGYYVIMGELSLGALVAALAAYKDVASPWNELLKFYQIKEDVRVKYDQIIEQFDPPGLLEAERLDELPEEPQSLQGDFVATHLVYGDDGGHSVDGISLTLDTRQWVAVVGGPHSGKHDFARLAAGLVRPDAGRVSIGGVALAQCPQAVLGGRIGYIDNQTYLFAGSVLDNVHYGLKRRPAPIEDQGQAERRKWMRDARLSGSSEYDPAADWTDYPGIGADGAEGLSQQCMAVLELVGLRDDLFQFGLRSVIAPQTYDGLEQRLLAARQQLCERLSAPSCGGIVESFDPQAYNQNASLAENLLFGSTNDPDLSGDRLPAHPYVRKVLEDCELYQPLLDIGRQVAQTMVELFADLPPGHEFFQQFSFISAEDLPGFQVILGRIDKQGLEQLAEPEQVQLLSLAFRLVPSRHRLGLLDADIQTRVVEARRRFAEGLPGELQPLIEFFDAGRFNSAISVQDNILFGRVVYGQAFAEARVSEHLHQVVDSLDLARDIVRVGLDYPVGIGGSRLTAEQRQKIGWARALLKRPDWLVVNGGSSALDAAAERQLLARLREETEAGALWVLDRAEAALDFDRVVVLDQGRLGGQGEPHEMAEQNALLRRLLGRD